MRYTPATCEQREAMLRAVGVSTVDGLFEDIPQAVRLAGGLKLPGGLSELELSEHLKALAGRNRHADELVSFLGAGCYDHYVPAIVDAVVSKPSFFTAYTPYQPEVSQGTLQAIYEFQTMIASLTGMDFANASMYDGATALVEAALMAARITKRDRVVASGSLHPEWRSTVATYARAGTIVLEECGSLDGTTDLGRLASLVDEETAAVLVSQPSFYGTLEDLEAVARIAHEVGAVLVVAANPILLGTIEAPAAFGADVVVGEGQPLGLPMSFGGPGFGFFACREAHIRQIPGRVVGRTVDADGRSGYALTMQTREQHIRREKATSNICSNHALAALAGSVYLSSVGAEGLAGIGNACIARAHYLRGRLIETGRFSAPWDAGFAHEFVLRYDGDVESMQVALLARGYLAGYALSRVERPDPGLSAEVAGSLVLFAATERRTRTQIDAFVEEVASL